MHLHLQSGEQGRLALLHLQLEQFPVQGHLISYLHSLDTSEWYPHWDIANYHSESLVQPKSCGEGGTVDPRLSEPQLSEPSIIDYPNRHIHHILGVH